MRSQASSIKGAEEEDSLIFTGAHPKGQQSQTDVISKRGDLKARRAQCETPCRLNSSSKEAINVDVE